MQQVNLDMCVWILASPGFEVALQACVENGGRVVFRLASRW